MIGCCGDLVVGCYDLLFCLTLDWYLWVALLLGCFGVLVLNFVGGLICCRCRPIIGCLFCYVYLGLYALFCV